MQHQTQRVPHPFTQPAQCGLFYNQIMNINITLDLPGIIAQACAPERLQPLIDKAIGEALKSSIDEATGYRSEFRKTMAAQLAEALPHGLGVDDVAKFQQVLNAAINKHVHDSNATAVKTAFDKLMNDVMPDVPEVVKLSDLLKEARDGLHKEQHEAFYAYWEPSDYGGGHLYLDDDEHPGSIGYGAKRLDREEMKYLADYRIAVNKDGDVYALRLDGKDVTPKSRPDVIGSFGSILMAMYVGRTRLEVDIDDNDVESASAEQYD